MKDELVNVVDEVNKILDENNEWKKRYAKYAQNLYNYNNFFVDLLINKIRKLKKDVKHDLSLHSTITSVIKNELFLMYRGLKVLKIKTFKNNQIYVYPIDKIDCDGKILWDNRANDLVVDCVQKAIKIIIKENKNIEFAVEASLKSKFKKGIRKISSFSGFAPIAVLEDRKKIDALYHFQMPIPISASQIFKDIKYLKYSKNSRPGIDVLLRSNRFNNVGETTFCVIEVKDSYKERERPMKAIKQAIAYATFIGRLLRTNKEEANKSIWYSFFRGNFSLYNTPGYIDKLKKPLIIKAIIAMPFKDKQPCLNFVGKSFAFNPKNSEDRIELGCINLITDSNNNVTDIEHYYNLDE